MIRFFISFLNTEIVISVLLFIIILLHFLPRRIPAAVWSVLWLIIALRIIVPFSVYRSPAFISADIPASPLEIRLTEYSPFSYSDEPSSSPESPQDQQVLKVSGAGKDAFFSMSVSQRMTNVLTGIFWVWLSGVICVLSVFSVRNLRLSRKLKRSIVNTDVIYETDLVENAAVFGIFKPVICVNPSSDPDIRDILISHEKTHIRRRDPLKKCIAFLLLSLNWFNPLAWVGFRYFLLDMEMACDEAVLKRKDHIYMIHYAEVLLKENTRLPQYKEAGMGFSGKQVKLRIKSVLNSRKTPPAVLVVSVLIMVFMTGCSFFSLLGISSRKTPEEIELFFGSDREAEDMLILTELTIDNTAMQYSNIWHPRDEMPEGWLGELLLTTDEEIYLLDHSKTTGDCLWYTVNGTNDRDYLIMENNGRYYLWKIYTGPSG